MTSKLGLLAYPSILVIWLELPMIASLFWRVFMFPQINYIFRPIL